jgi:hypothetical protein
VHWKGMKLSDLLEAEDRLVAHLEPLPFQEGRLLATVAESTELVDVSSEELISCQVLMAEEGEDDGDLPIIEFDVVSEDEATANTGDKNDADREARRTRNRARAAHLSHPIYKNINRAIIYAPGSSHAYIQQIIKISQHMS